MRNQAACLLLATTIILLTASCGGVGTDTPKSLSQDKDLAEMLQIAHTQDIDPALRYAALEPVISRYRNAGEIDALNSLLSEVVEENPDDPYGTYYLLAMAEGSREKGSDDLALDYLRRLLKNYPDLEIREQSLHLAAMEELASRTPDPREAISVRQDLIGRFPDRIDKGRQYYMLASDYRETGNWDAMYAAYRRFLEYPNTTIPGAPDARAKVRASIAFHESDKTWTMENLDDLVGTVKYAIRNQDARLLTRYQADNFFLMNWSQETSDSFTHIPMTLGSFLKSSIRYRRDLESFSNEREAYLWTAGWSWKIPTWYLYFRRIDYPADPEIHGNWEWAGIYFGERL